MFGPSKYLPYFLENKEKLSQTLRLMGDTLIVERLVMPEKKIGGLIIVDSKKVQTHGFTTEVPEFFRVLWVGQGYYNEDTGQDAPLEVKPGNIIHTAAASVKLWSSIPILESTDSGILGLTRYGDSIAQWETEEDFIQFLEGFNDSVKRTSSSA